MSLLNIIEYYADASNFPFVLRLYQSIRISSISYNNYSIPQIWNFVEKGLSVSFGTSCFICVHLL